MDIYRTRVGPFPGCPSHEALKDIYDVAQPPLPSDIDRCDIDVVEERQSSMFFPRKAIKDILDKPRIEIILKCNCESCTRGHESSPPKFETLVAWVVDHGRILLAILIYLGHTWLINSLGQRSDRISDENLEAVLNVISERRPVGLSPNFKRSYKSALRLFQPRKFTMGSPTFSYSHQDRFPYLNTKSIAKGSFGEVFSFEIHPDYIDDKVLEKYSQPQWSPTKTKCVFARKVLKKGLDDDDMRMEEDVLRVIDKQGHDNIIDIIAFYSWRDEVNFVFPFVELNLYHVLHHDWRPEHVAEPSHIDCRGHWLWQQLIGVADALRTIHNPPIQSWPDSGKIVGFHFDLKPANVMVRHDGRLLVTDFGQSMVKLVQENELIYGDYIGGDYAYQPPEVCPSRTVWKETLRSIEPSPSPLPTSPPGTVITSSSSRKNSSGTVASSERRRESKRSWGSSAIYRADDSSLSHAASYSLSEVSPSATSGVSRVTATTNYDVWSLACIMVEALVFICKDGSRGVIAFEGDRQSEERDLSFHDGNANAQLKKCVTKILAEIRVLERVVDGTVPIQRPSYLCDIVDMLGGMFCSDPKERLSSEEVVNKLESIGKAHEDDESPDDPMLMRMESMPIPRGFKEVGWSPNGMDVGVTSFYHMENIEFEMEKRDSRGGLTRAVVDAKFQVFYKQGKDSAFHIRIGYQGSYGLEFHKPIFSVKFTLYFPIYLFDTVQNRQNACILRDRHDEILLRFGNRDDLLAFQTVIMGYKPLHGLRTTSFSLHPILGKVEAFTNLNDPEDWPWPRCQIWEENKIERMTLSSHIVPRKDSNKNRILILFCGQDKDFIGIPLMDGRKALQEEVVKPPEDPTAVTIKFKDRWNKHFLFIRPRDTHRFMFGAPAMALDPVALIPDVEDVTRQATQVTIKFSEHKYLRKFYSSVDETNRLNHESNVITLRRSKGNQETIAAQSRRNTLQSRE